MAERQVRGLILLGVRDISDQYIRGLLTANIPRVLADNYVNGLAASCVLGDNAMGAYLATRHLSELGHRRIAILERLRKYKMLTERIEGYPRALDEGCLPPEAALIQGPLHGDSRKGFLETQALLALPGTQRPTANFAVSDKAALGAVEARKGAGVRIPEDISLVGFDAIAECVHATPALTTIRYPLEGIGQTAARRSIDRVEGVDVPPYKILLPTELVVRASSSGYTVATLERLPALALAKTTRAVRCMCSGAPKSGLEEYTVEDGVAFTYTGSRTKEISFPLGGIGCGSIGLAGNGRLIDWEIFNRPNKNSVNGFSHFAIKAEADGRVLDTRVLHGDLAPPYTGTSDAEFTGFGFGVSRAFLTGVPHFREATFEGAYPFATIRFADDRFPGDVSLSAFNPLIPLNDADSSIPAAFFSVEVRNDTAEHKRYIVCAVLKNPLPVDTLSRALVRDDLTLLQLTSASLAEDDVHFGDMTLGTDAADVSYQQYWFRGAWFDNLQVYWRDLTAPGPLKDRIYTRPLPHADRGFGDHCSLAGHIDLAPGEAGCVRFVVSWSFPNVTNYWNPLSPEAERAAALPHTWKNYYAMLFEDSTASAVHALRHWDHLHRETRRFADALFASTLPPAVLDAVSANISVLKSATVLRLQDGSFYGFEGCHSKAGSCEGSCTHVWNYAYALPFLFPALERSMRDLDYRYNMHANGKMGFRLQLPLGRSPSTYHAAADGQFGGVVKAYRDWKISGNDAWLRANWPAIERAITYAWDPTNEDRWDLDKDGVLEGRQHHTLDTELFGPNAYLTGFYLAALKAGAAIATHLGEEETAREYRALFERGRAWVDRNLFNGEYYYHRIDVTDQALLAPYRDSPDKPGHVEDYYWDDEHGEIKYQIAEGCHIDQVIAQWHANICGLGEIFDRAQVQSALRAIYRHNFKRSMRDYFNPCRVYALNDEAALVICDWPEGKPKPAVPLPYAEEAQNGYEYQAAVHMIQEGLVDEGLAVVEAIRDRYDGEKRNPWNEFECGSNYARSMASYALLPALSGFEFDMTRGHIGFAPVLAKDSFRCFWSLDCAWGVYERQGATIRLWVESGTLQLRSYADSLIGEGGSVHVHAGDPPRFRQEGACIHFASPVLVKPGAALEIVVTAAGPA